MGQTQGNHLTMTRSTTEEDRRAVRAAPAAMVVTAFLILAGFAVAAPLAVYTLTLALFGLPHVLSELRYVDRRFGQRIGRRLLLTIAGLLAAIAATRTAGVFHLLPTSTALPLELSLVAALALSVAGGSVARRATALTIGLGIGAATALAPFDTAVTFSILHNLTPLGFLWQLSPPAARARLIVPATSALLGLPLLVATGLPHLALESFGLVAPGTNPLHAGPLGAQLFVYVPGALSASRHAVDFFTASVVAQVGHYLSVIVVLPVLLARLEPGARGIIPWPRGRWFFAGLAIVSLISLMKFAVGFAEARSFYGIFASVHAWLEIPVLILALTGGAQRVNSNPATADAVLATSDTSMAR